MQLVSLTGTNIFKFEISIMFITISMIDSWLRGSVPLRGLPIIPIMKKLCVWEGRKCIYEVCTVREILRFFFHTKATTEQSLTTSEAMCSSGIQNDMLKACCPMSINLCSQLNKVYSNLFAYGSHEPTEFYRMHVYWLL